MFENLTLGEGKGGDAPRSTLKRLCSRGPRGSTALVSGAD
jgi:hypothetical protein